MSVDNSTMAGGEEYSTAVSKKIPALKLDGVSVTFRAQDGSLVDAVKNVDLTVADGEFISIVGPSGCGKTTLLKMCANLQLPTAGSIIYRGQVGAIEPGEFGMVLQSPALFPWKTIAQNIAMPERILNSKKKRSEEDIRTRVEELLDLMQLPPVAERYPWELSGGMQQRVSIARALFLDPPLVLMDEPFGALDALTREELNMHFERVQMTERKTVLFVTHSISEAVILSDRIVVMSATPGRIMKVVENKLPRPRDEHVLASSEFTEMAAIIRDLLNSTKVQKGKQNVLS
jgi:NitT/TauT family transport system ATP-binding protein